MDVKYIPADWERMKSGLGDLIGLGRWGKGMIDDLKKISRNMEDAESDISRYDSDGVINFSHMNRESTYQELFEDFKVMHNFTGKVGDIVDRTIDQPFYEDIDAFVSTMQQATISNYTTSNRLGITEEKTYYTQGMNYTTRSTKAEVSLDDLLSGDNFYASQMRIEYDMWKAENPDQDFSQEDYRMAAVNMNAFEYSSIEDQQLNKEFWVSIGAAVVIVGVAVICPPAGLALGAAYGTLELSSAVSGKDWLTSRELGTGERWLRGALAPLDIVPGVAGLKKFGTGVRLSNQVVDMGQMAVKPGLRSTVQRELTHVGDMLNTAGAMTVQRVKNAGSAVRDASRVARDKVARDIQDVGRLADSAVTSMKNMIPTRTVLAADDVGRVHLPGENTPLFDDKAKEMFSKAEGVNTTGAKAKSELHFENVGEYFNHTNDIGKRTDLTAEQKLEKIHEAYRSLGDLKGDVTVVSDTKYLKTEAFGSNGRPQVDWPDKMGFAEGTIQPVTRNNRLPEQWDRIGGKGGENFTTLPENRAPFTYDERAIPYLENPSARHIGTFDNDSYFAAIDSIKNGNLEELNKVAVANGKNPISNADFLDFKASYIDFQKNIKEVIGNVDATYGLKGSAAPWKSSTTGEKLMGGGAEQILTPLNAEMLEMVGVIPKY